MISVIGSATMSINMDGDSCPLPSQLKPTYDFNWKSKSGEWQNAATPTDYMMLALSWWVFSRKTMDIQAIFIVLCCKRVVTLSVLFTFAHDVERADWTYLFVQALTFDEIIFVGVQHTVLRYHNRHVTKNFNAFIVLHLDWSPMDYGLKQPKLLQFVLTHAIAVMNHNWILHLSNNSFASCLQKFSCKPNGKNTV